MAENVQNVLRAQAVLNLDNQQRLYKAPTLLRSIDIIRKDKATLANGLFEGLLILGSKRRIAADHLKDQTS